MTKAQRIALQADWWPAACRSQGWSSTDRDLRLRVCAWAVSLDNPTQHQLLEAIRSDRTPTRWLESTNDLDNGPDIDRVKACLGMLADKMRETAEVGRPEIGRARRLRDRIRAHLKCLALYHNAPRQLLASLVADMFKRPAGCAPFTIRDLTDAPQFYRNRPTNQTKEGPSHLERVVMRLAAIVNQKRNENVLVGPYLRWQGTLPLTIHEMKLIAGVGCDCAICARIQRQQEAGPAEENWTDFDPEPDQDCEVGTVPVGAGEEGNPF